MTIEPAELYDRSSSISIRWIVYIHLAGVVFTASLSLADSRLLISPEFSNEYFSFFETPPLTSLLFTGMLFGCPLLMLFSLFEPSLKWNQKVIGAIAEFLLTLGHLFVLLTAIQ